MQNNHVRYCIIVFACILTFFLLLYISPRRTVGDFDVFYASSQRYMDRAPVYIPHSGIEEFKYSPVFALVFSPLTLLSRTAALYAWDILNIFLLYSVFFLLYRLKQVSFSKPQDLWIIICFFALTGPYIFSNIMLGQTNILLCFLMVLTMYWEINKKYFWASVALAFSLMIKFIPVIFLVYFILRRRYKLAGFTFLMIAFFLLLPSIYTGFDLNLKYLHDWFKLLSSSPPSLFYSANNNSLLAFYSWVFIVRHQFYYVYDYNLITRGLSPEVYYFWGVSCLVLFFAFFYDAFSLKFKERETVFLDYSCLFVCGLLFNPLAYFNALVLLTVPYFFILRHLFYLEKNRTLCFMIAILVSFGVVLNIIGHKPFFKDVYQYYLFIVYKPLMWAVIMVYLSLCLAKFSPRLQR